MFRVPAELDLAVLEPRGRPVGPQGKSDAAQHMVRALLVGLAAVVLAGCAAPAAPIPASTPGSPASSPPPTITAAPDPDAAACAEHVGTAATVRSIAGAVANGPVLPAGVALFLLDARDQASKPVSDPALAAAQAETVAAIDDVDAQGNAGLPPGGNPARDKVALDTTRILAAVEAVERVCAGR